MTWRLHFQHTVDRTRSLVVNVLLKSVLTHNIWVVIEPNWLKVKNVAPLNTDLFISLVSLFADPSNLSTPSPSIPFAHLLIFLSERKRIPPVSQYQLCLKKKYTATPNEQKFNVMVQRFLLNKKCSCKRENNKNVLFKSAFPQHFSLQNWKATKGGKEGGFKCYDKLANANENMTETIDHGP